MSAEATGWVFRESPYKGVLFAVHLAMADTVNDTYHNEFWASTSHLAAKARVSERMVRRGLHQMVSDGLLELVAERPGTTKRYRFVMDSTPDTSAALTPVHPGHQGPKPLTPVQDPLTPVQGTPDTSAPNPNRTQEIPKGSQLVRASSPNGFDEFWVAYPAKKGKGAARDAWVKAVKRAPVATIIEGAIVYAESDERVANGYIKNPATWLNQDCWEDEPVRAPIPKRMQGISRWLEATT